ncbi:hypothetical protein D3C87_1479310 [compost metagenome]
MAGHLRRGLEPHCAGKRDHRAVIGAEGEVRVVDVHLAAAAHLVQALAQLLVGAHAAGHHQALVPGLLERGERLGREHVDDGIDKRAREVRAILLARVRKLAGLCQHGGLEPCEREIEVARMKHRPGQVERARRAERGHPRHFRATRIAQAE